MKMIPKIEIDVVTIFPDMFKALTDFGVISRAIRDEIVHFKAHNLRDYTKDKHKVTDLYAYGGGPGMVMKPEPFFEFYDKYIEEKGTKPYIILTSPQGKHFDTGDAERLAQKKNLVFFCGRYEGIDERVMNIVDEELSIGDFVVTGGELPAMLMIDALLRFVPGVVGDIESVKNDSFYNTLLDHPHYTKPRNYRGMEVPEVLLSGNHKKIDEYRKKESLLRTILKRPDLFIKHDLDEFEKRVLVNIIRELISNEK
ncbi:tRNA (guanine-N1)-methyltransferase [Marinitoga piezophila KA3]|uniref:tRNA (guanine-N(1)-)-methyltransferase n=1 Tax=Marinitoga piezophila (strain DSM 14283 / JCM 11233 / KA3) TaxID=443254 RepID=H2J6U4_MARPK|nr:MULTISPECIES: tRNA (guanosine(37)-N1)-methyltransferase TrmD [Marinitoga]AEX85209.1 tRNA (guanine-N1)-methyltransferase [Marinitoga piezophila KA3]